MSQVLLNFGRIFEENRFQTFTWRMKTKQFVSLSFLFVCLLAGIGCEKEKLQGFHTNHTQYFKANVPLEWNKLFLEIDRYATGYHPPATSRMLAYSGLAAYESAVAGMPNNSSLGNHFPELILPPIQMGIAGKAFHWPSCVNAAYADMFRFFYPHVKPALIAKINDLEKMFADEFEATVSAQEIARSVNYGKKVAAAVINWSKTDPYGHNAYLNPFSPYNAPGMGPNGEIYWEPTPPDFTPAIFPDWGGTRSFAMMPQDQLAKPPVPWSKSEASNFYNQAFEVSVQTDYLKTNAMAVNDRWIVEFWSDDIFQLTFDPAARWISIANQMVEADDINLAKAVLLYAQMGLALADVGTAVWKSKYHYHVERPVTYINRVIKPGWKPYLNDPIKNIEGFTPSTPSYPSEHAGFSSAGAAILTHVFGERTFTDWSHAYREEFKGLPRTFHNFRDASDECAYSRLSIGVHFRMDLDSGLHLGQKAAQRVLELPWTN